MQDCLKQISTLAAKIKSLEGEKIQLLHQVKEANARFQMMVKECKLKLNLIDELKMENNEFERKL